MPSSGQCALPSTARSLVERLRFDAGTGYGRSINPDDDDSAIDGHVEQVSRRVALGVHLPGLAGGCIEAVRVLNIGAWIGVEAVVLTRLRERILGRAAERGVPVSRCTFITDDIVATHE